MCRNNVADECARSTYGSDLATGCTERSYGRDVQDFYQNRKYSKLWSMASGHVDKRRSADGQRCGSVQIVDKTGIFNIS